jgi:reverse gyrase
MEEFTRQLEEIMDKIEEGKEDYEKILRKLYFDVTKESL